LTGTVTVKATGQPLPGAFVGTSFGATATTNSIARYSFENVPLGNNNVPESWSVTVDPPSGSALQPEIQTVTVGPIHPRRQSSTSN
jgi:hypothetical protein